MNGKIHLERLSTFQHIDISTNRHFNISTFQHIDIPNINISTFQPDEHYSRDQWYWCPNNTVRIPCSPVINHWCCVSVFIEVHSKTTGKDQTTKSLMKRTERQDQLTGQGLTGNSSMGNPLQLSDTFSMGNPLQLSGTFSLLGVKFCSHYTHRFYPPFYLQNFSLQFIHFSLQFIPHLE